jgi:hypothetical protein
LQTYFSLSCLSDWFECAKQLLLHLAYLTIPSINACEASVVTCIRKAKTKSSLLVGIVKCSAIVEAAFILQTIKEERRKDIYEKIIIWKNTNDVTQTREYVRLSPGAVGSSFGILWPRYA